MTLPPFVSLFVETFKEWNEDKASRLAAALAYYTAFSIAPLMLLLVAVAGLVFGQQAAQGSIFAQLEGLLGADAAASIESAVASSQKPSAGIVSAVIGLVTLVWSSANVFGQLQDALNTIWEVKPKSEGIVASVKRRIVPISMVLGVAFLLLVSLVLSAGLALLGEMFGRILPVPEAVLQAVNFIVSFLIISLLFAAIYKFLPDVKISWKDVWLGAMVTALLFTIGKTLIGLYLGHASIGSTYGAAGSLLVFLVWVYYSAQILFFGAEFTQVYAKHRGSRIVPTEHAEPLTEEARAEQGAPHDRDESATEKESARSEPAKSEPVRSEPTKESVHTTSALLIRTQHNAVALQEHDAPLLKKMLWMGLASGSLGLVGVVAHRMNAALWRLMFHQDPPSNH